MTSPGSRLMTFPTIPFHTSGERCLSSAMAAGSIATAGRIQPHLGNVIPNRQMPCDLHLRWASVE